MFSCLGFLLLCQRGFFVSNLFHDSQQAWDGKLVNYVRLTGCILCTDTLQSRNALLYINQVHCTVHILSTLYSS